MAITLATIMVIAGLPAATHAQAQKGRPDVAFDSSSGRVTVRVSPHELQGVTLPFPLRNRLAVLDNGRPRTDAEATVEHEPFTLAVLIENGSRSHQLNRLVTSEMERFLRPLLPMLDVRDRLAVFTYDDTVRTIVDVGSTREQWDAAIGRLPAPRYSESNFYDAMDNVLTRLTGITGRRALLVLSTGIDTFSRVTVEDVIRRATALDVPVHVVSLGDLGRTRLSPATRGPLARVDWVRCERQLQQLAQRTGGLIVRSTTSSDVEGAYEDIVERLRVRYALSYVPDVGDAPGARKVEVAILDAAVPGARLADGGRRSGALVIAEGNYAPRRSAASATSAGGEQASIE